jgi:hypothetical protein
MSPHTLYLYSLFVTFRNKGWVWIWHSWIRASWYSYENDQQTALYKLIYYSKLALRVSGDVFSHHQEQLTVFTVSGSVHPSCCRLVSWMSRNCEQLYMFRAMFLFIIRSTWLYLQYLVVFTQVAAGWQPAATWVNTTIYCKYSQVLLMMGVNIARNM